MNAIKRELLHAQIAAYVSDGHTLQDAMRHFRVNYYRVWNACVLAGIDAKKDLPNRTYEIIAALIHTDKTLTEIADQFQMTRANVSVIYNKARKAGIQIAERIQGVRPKPDHASTSFGFLIQ
jgi:DNA-directed RNA polymerase specialized sigma subunit